MNEKHTPTMRCGWFGEGRGQCLLLEGHRSEHTCEEDGRLLRVAQTGLAAVAERQRQLDASSNNSHDALVAALECESAIDDMGFDEGRAVLNKHGWQNGECGRTATEFARFMRRAALKAPL